MLGIEGSTFTSDTGIDRGTYPNGGKSLVLDGSADYLSRTFAGDDGDTWTLSFWVKRANIGTNAAGENGGYFANSSDNEGIAHLSLTGNSGKIVVNDTAAGDPTTASHRDFHGWHHFCLVSTSGTQELYIDNIIEAHSGTWNITTLNSAITHWIGRHTAYGYNGCYLSDFKFCSTTAYTPSDFAHTSADTGKWVMGSDTTLTYGTNGFSLDFNDDRSGTPDTTTTIYDQSGNSNNWTGNSLVAGSFTSDVPNNSYATLNPLDSQGRATTLASAPSNGNLTQSSNSIASWQARFATMRLPLGKYYFEVTHDQDANAYNIVGLCKPDLIFGASAAGFLAGSCGYINHTGDTVTGIWKDNTRLVTSTTNHLSGDVLQVAVDTTGGDGAVKVWFGINDTWLGAGSPEPDTDTDAPITDMYYPCIPVHSMLDTSGYSMTWNFGATDFAYTPPTDFLPLSSANLPVPAATYRKPQNFADIALYTGDGVAIGSGGNAVTGLDFQPDLTWIKNRDAADSHQWTDIVRGVTKNLSSDSTALEGTDTEGLTSFTSGGFTVGSDVSYNTNTEDYWAMCLKADNTSGSSNTDGSITTTVSAGQHFSIVQWSGDGATTITAGHGLPFAPDLIILKDKDSGTGGWQVYHSSNTSAPETDYLLLHSTNATVDNVNRWNDTAPTNEVFTVHSNINGSGTNNMIAYCFVFDTTDANSPFTGGSFESNGNTSSDGVFIPSDQLLMLCTKSIDSTSNWQLFDQVRNTYNPVDTHIAPNDTPTEATLGTTAKIDLVSNGSKVVMTSAVDPNVAETYIWWGIKKDGGQLWA